MSVGSRNPLNDPSCEMRDTISPSATRFGEGVKLLFRWHGSIYRLMWLPILLYFTTYMAITLLYELILSEAYKRDFEAIAQYCSKYTGSIPVILLLGFFTTTAMQRWFSMYNSIPGTARIITAFTMSLKDNIGGQKMVDTYARLALLVWAMTFQIVCKPFRKMFVSLSSLQKAGLLLEHERKRLEDTLLMEERPLMVLDWMFQILKRAQRQSNFLGPNDYSKNVETLMAFKKSCTNVLKFTGKNIPMALLQAVAITVYVFGLASLMSRQFVEKNRATILLSGYFPVLHSLQYFLYFAWWKFGHIAANPFGEDEDDINILELFVKHVKDARRLVRNYSNGDEYIVTESLDYSDTVMDNILLPSDDILMKIELNLATL